MFIIKLPAIYEARGSVMNLYFISADYDNCGRPFTGAWIETFKCHGITASKLSPLHGGVIRINAKASKIMGRAWGLAGTHVSAKVYREEPLPDLLGVSGGGFSAFLRGRPVQVYCFISAETWGGATRDEVRAFRVQGRRPW